MFKTIKAECLARNFEQVGVLTHLVNTGSLSRAHEGIGEEAIDTKVVAPHDSHFLPDSKQHFNIRQGTTARTLGTIANQTAKTVRLVLLVHHRLGHHHPCEIFTVYVYTASAYI